MMVVYKVARVMKLSPTVLNRSHSRYTAALLHGSFTRERAAVWRSSTQEFLVGGNGKEEGQDGEWFISKL